MYPSEIGEFSIECTDIFGLHIQEFFGISKVVKLTVYSFVARTACNSNDALIY